MKNRKTLAAFGAPLVLGLAMALAPVSLDAKDADETTRITDEGINRSEVQMTAHELVDQIGPRLSNSPNMRIAEAWAVAEMEELGLSKVHKEGFEFGRGW